MNTRPLADGLSCWAAFSYRWSALYCRPLHPLTRDDGDEEAFLPCVVLCAGGPAPTTLRAHLTASPTHCPGVEVLGPLRLPRGRQDLRYELTLQADPDSPMTVEALQRQNGGAAGGERAAQAWEPGSPPVFELQCRMHHPADARARHNLQPGQSGHVFFELTRSVDTPTSEHAPDWRAQRFPVGYLVAGHAGGGGGGEDSAALAGAAGNPREYF